VLHVHHQQQKQQHVLPQAVLTSSFLGTNQPTHPPCWSLLLPLLFLLLLPLPVLLCHLPLLLHTTVFCMGSFPALSCEFATLDVSDALGTKRMNLTKTLRKTPIDLNLDHHGAAYEDNHKVQPKYDDEDMWVSHEGSQGGGVDGGWGGGEGARPRAYAA
jgi:hypothetical protein